jgi:hypothetical protein
MLSTTFGGGLGFMNKFKNVWAVFCIELPIVIPGFLNGHPSLDP